MHFLLAIMLTSLLLGIEWELASAIVRPFDFLFLGFAAIFGLRVIGLQKPVVTVSQFGFLREPSALAFIAFMALSTISALQVGLGNFAREALQAVELVVIFIATAILVGQVEKVEKLTKLVLILTLVVMVFVVIWHWSNGVFFGYKRLQEPKIAFSVLPVMLAIMVDRRRVFRSLFPFIWIGLAVLVYLSGERKAMLAFLAVSGLIYAYAFNLTRAPKFIAFALIAATSVSIAFFTDPSLITRLVPNISADISMYTASMQQAFGVNNLHKLLTLQIGLNALADQPLFGLGTNGYVDLIQRQYSWLPPQLRLGIHGEFLRVLVENGVVGMLLYLSIWATALARSVALLSQFRYVVHQDSLLQVERNLAVFFAFAIVFAAFDVAGTEMTIVLALVALAPIFVGHVLRRMASRSRNLPAGFSHLDSPSSIQSRPDQGRVV